MINERTYKKVGNFTLSQPQMLVSDPGYDKEEWCSKIVNDCKTGIWNAYINTNEYVYKYENAIHKDHRVAALMVKHESVQRAVFDRIHWNAEGNGEGWIRWTGPWKNLSENIGVDSGQAGFFDLDKYGDNDQFDQEGECEFGDKWYSNCCDQTLHKDAGIVADCGVNASSGYGDGCYAVWGHTTASGKVDAMILFFLPDNDDCDE